MKKIGLIFYLPELKSYIDRFHLVLEISKYTEKTFLVTSKKNIDITKISLPENFEIIEFSKGRRYPGRTYLKASSTVAKLIETNEINIVHDTFGHLIPLFIIKKKYPDCIFITSLFNISEWDLRKYIWPKYQLRCITNYNLRFWLTRIPIQRIICKFADHVIVQAPELIDRLIEYIKIPKNKISYITNNIELLNNKNKLNIKIKDKKVTEELLYVGGFGVAKGGFRLLKLLKLAKEKNVDIRASIIGGITELDKKFLIKKISDFNVSDLIKIHDRKSYDEVKIFMSNSDWLFHLSDVDGSPRVVLEALSRCLPVIGSNHPGIKVLDPEKKFIQFADDDMGKLLEKIINISNEEYNEIVRVGYESVSQNFNSSEISNKYINLYSNLIELGSNEIVK